ncbi:MAG: hypothetical protein HOV71_15945 [Hamadaea sp.]|nr:hypothetical protein [Hamadaea sp.]NUR49622.1 hypothetical protein [Hamadaea sp.]NUT04509.1 hypothetical protein [Hamadaea sp.]
MEPESITPMTDDEAELFRFIRYGQLPDRVPPSRMVESVETSAPQEDPVPYTDPGSPFYHGNA